MKPSIRSTGARLSTVLLSLSVTAVLAGPPVGGELEKQPTNWHAIIMFCLFVAMTMGITYWAAGRTKSTSDFYTAGGGITGFQNGMAIAGDYMSAATLLGLTAMVYGQGYDGYVYMMAFFAGWPLILFLMAERLRNLGKFTFSDITAYRLDQGKVRTMAAVSSLTVVCFYLIAQMVGAGQLIKLLFGLDYNVAVIVVGVLMVVYVTFGGMIATTWVQIIKAVLLLLGVTVLTVMVLAQFHFNPGELYGAVAAKYGQSALEPGGLVSNPLDAISLGLALMFGVLGLPHILMRFYTVPDAKQARKSVLVATGFIGYFYIIIPIVGFGAAALLPGLTEGGLGRELITSFDKGGNMAAPLLAEHLGGTAFLGFIAAVAFATILAVVAGLTLAGASSLSHDIYVSVIKKGEATEAQQVAVARTATIVFGSIAVLLGMVFKQQNVAFMVGLAFAVACSANFPSLLLSIVWKRFTTAGAVSSILTGAVLALTLIIIGPTVWVDVLKHEKAIFPLKNPAIVSMTAAFLVGIVVSLMSPEKRAEELFEDEKLRTYLGVGAE
jgi:cation/acetate symporter